MEHDLGNPYTNHMFQEAVEHNDIAVVKTLLRYSTFLRRNQRNRNRLTALQQSVLDGNGRMTILLLENGSDIEAKTSNGWTCLHIAAALGDVDILTTLINHCASLLALTKDEELPIDLAATREVKIKLAKEMSRIGYGELAQWYMKKLAAEKGGFYILSATTLLDLACDDSYNSVSLYDCADSIREDPRENEDLKGKQDIGVGSFRNDDILVNKPVIEKCSSKSPGVSTENSPSHEYLETFLAESNYLLADVNSLDKNDCTENVSVESGTISADKSIHPNNSIVLNIDYCNLVDQDDGAQANDADTMDDLFGVNTESDVKESMIYLENSGKHQHQKIMEHSSPSPQLGSQACSKNTSLGSYENTSRESCENISRESCESTSWKSCENTSRESSENTSWKSCENASRESCEKTSRESCENISRESCENMSWKSCENASRESCENTSRGSCENISRESCENTSWKSCENTSRGSCENTSRVSCDNISRESCENISWESCENTSQESCEITSWKSCENTSKGSCENTSGGSCENISRESCENTSGQSCETSRGSRESFQLSHDTSTNSKCSLQSLSDCSKPLQPAHHVFSYIDKHQIRNLDRTSQVPSSGNERTMQYHHPAGLLAQNHCQTAPVDIPVHSQPSSCGAKKHLEAEDTANDFCNCPNCKKLGYALSPDIGAISPGAVRAHLERERVTRGLGPSHTGVQLQRSQTVQGKNPHTTNYPKDRQGDQILCYSKSHLHKPRKRKKKLFSGIKSMFKDTIKSQQWSRDESSVVDDAGISVAFVFQDRRKLYGLKGETITKGNDSFSRCTSPYCSDRGGSHTIFHKNTQQQGKYNNNAPLNQELNRNQVHVKVPPNLGDNYGQYCQQNKFGDQSAREERPSELRTTGCDRQTMPAECRTMLTDQWSNNCTSPQNVSDVNNMMSQMKIQNQDNGAALQPDRDEPNSAFLSPSSLRRDIGR